MVPAACATAPPPPAPPEPGDAWAAAREIVGALPPAGLRKWASLSPEQQDEIVRAAEPFLLRWMAASDTRALGVVLTTFSAMWNERTPAPSVHCTFLQHIVCY